MCSISVEPMPSTISTPKCALKRSPMSAGSASPADDTRRSATSPRAGSRGEAQHAGKAGGRAEKDRGLHARLHLAQRLKVASGVGRSAISTWWRPPLSGKVSALPRP
jgi:hypothetical protein